MIYFVQMIKKSYSIKRCGISLVFAAALLTYAGCGGGSSDDQTDSLTRAQFIAQVNAICATTEKKAQTEYVAYVRRNNVPASGGGLNAKAADFMSSVVAPLYQNEIEQISSLGIPDGDKKEIGSILDAMRQGLNKGQDEPLAFIRGENTSLVKASKLAGAYGLTSCTRLL